MDRTKYVFKRTDCEHEYKPEKRTYKFYQLCLYPNQYNNRHWYRKIYINELGNILKVSESTLNERQYIKFIRNEKPNTYKLYSTYDLSIIDLPNPVDILRLQSPLLNMVITNDDNECHSKPYIQYYSDT